jgi:proteasome lid subunit RPN8/RPN11
MQADRAGTVPAVELPHQIREAMVSHARFAAPEEACGLLAADESDRLQMVYCLTNVDASPVAYTLDPSEHIKALHHADRHGWRLAGVYHSHPRGDAVPSATDISKALEPEWIYAIVGLAGSEPEVRAFHIRAGRVTEEPLVEVDS